MISAKKRIRPTRAKKAASNKGRSYFRRDAATASSISWRDTGTSASSGDDGLGGLGGDGTHLEDRLILDVADARLRRGEFLRHFGLDGGALLFGSRLGLVAGAAGDAAGIGAGLGERLLVGGERLLGFALELLGRVEIAGDAVAAALENAGDPRDRDLGHDVVEEHEGDREPEKLRSEGRGVERRECLLAGMKVRRLLGMRPGRIVGFGLP